MAKNLNIKRMKCTKFEKARLIGARALQLSMGAPFAIKLSKKDLERLRYNTIEISKLEFEKGVIPISVKRIIPVVVEEKKKEKIVRRAGFEPAKALS